MINLVRARAKVLARENREMRAALVAARRNAGLTQRDVAERMGISQQAVNKLERYDADPRQSTLERYANAVGAIVQHRVVVDNGAALRLAENSPWRTTHASGSRSSVRHVTPLRTGTVDGWRQLPEAVAR